MVNFGIDMTSFDTFFFIGYIVSDASVVDRVMSGTIHDFNG